MLTGTDKEILFNTFLKSLGVVKSCYPFTNTFLLPSKSFLADDKMIGKYSGDTYYMYGHPNTNNKIIEYLKEHDIEINKIYYESDKPEKIGGFNKF